MTRSRLAIVSTSVAERDKATPKATTPMGNRVPDEDRDCDREDEEGDRESLLYVGRLVSELKTDTTVEPTPEVSD